MAASGNSFNMAQLPSESLFGDYSEWPGRDVLDSGGERLGGVREIYLDRETGHPEWVLVDVEGDTSRFVPLADAEVGSATIRVAHTASQINSAPGIGAESQIDQTEERRLTPTTGSATPRAIPAAKPPPAPTGWGGWGDDTPSWQARGGEAGDSPTSSDTAASPPSAYEAARGLLVPPPPSARPTPRRPGRRVRASDRLGPRR